MAVGGLRHGQGPFWGGAIGRNPTDRGKAGSKKSILVDAAGGPLSVAVAGANVHDTKLLRPTLESIVVARPEGTQNLCLDKGYDNPTGHGTVAAFPVLSAHPAHWGRRSWTDGGRRPFPPPVGGGAHLELAVQVPGDTGALRQEGIPTTWASSSWRAPCSGTAVSTDYCFEIVSNTTAALPRTRNFRPKIQLSFIGIGDVGRS